MAARKRVQLTVEIDLDPVPGTFHTVDSAREQVQRILRESIPHYRPETIIPEPKD